MIVGVAFIGGTLVNSIVAFGQGNTTTVYAPVVQSSDALIASIIAGIIAVAGLIKTFVDKGWLDKKVGTVAVMAADTAVAVRDNRQTIKDIGQTTYDTIKLTNPSATATADEKIAPAMDRATLKLNEYTGKVDRFSELANKLSKGGTQADDKIEDMKDEIPDKIVPS